MSLSISASRLDPWLDAFLTGEGLSSRSVEAADEESAMQNETLVQPFLVQHFHMRRDLSHQMTSVGVCVVFLARCADGGDASATETETGTDG